MDFKISLTENFYQSIKHLNFLHHIMLDKFLYILFKLWFISLTLVNIISQI